MIDTGKRVQSLDHFIFFFGRIPLSLFARQEYRKVGVLFSESRPPGSTIETKAWFILPPTHPDHNTHVGMFQIKEGGKNYASLSGRIECTLHKDPTAIKLTQDLYKGIIKWPEYYRWERTLPPAQPNIDPNDTSSQALTRIRV